MSEQSAEQIRFDFFTRLPIIVEAHDAPVSSDAGILPIRQFDDHIGLTDRFIACLDDPRDPEQIDHPFGEMVRQRLFGILAGYEDCNDHDTLRGDPVFKMVSGRAPDDPKGLASQPTLSRFENVIRIASLWKLHDFFIDDFIRSFSKPPAFLTLDIDAMDDACHGDQQLALFHGFYDQYQYLTLVISCAETKQILWPTVRPGNVHAALGADDDLEYVVHRLRAAWPDVVIHIRGDAGFGVPWMYAVCERLQLFYTFGLATNAVLKRATEALLQRAVRQFEETRESQRRFDQFLYRAGSWKNPRRVIVKAECNPVGTNLRFVVTNRPGAAILPQGTYDEYVERGESENRNKELKCGLAGDRLSCHRFVANYFRFMLHAAALNLLVQLRRVVADPPGLTARDQAAMSEPGDVPVADPELPVAVLTGATAIPQLPPPKGPLGPRPHRHLANDVDQSRRPSHPLRPPNPSPHPRSVAASGLVRLRLPTDRRASGWCTSPNLTPQQSGFSMGVRGFSALIRTPQCTRSIAASPRLLPTRHRGGHE